jgi:hypothetical protein
VRRKKPATPPPPAPATTKQPTTATPAAPGVSAIGQLGSGGGSDRGWQTAYAISVTERGLSTINRPLSDSELKTVSRIREFLRKARQALDSGDVDGARTLAAKAKVLLGELTR